MNGILHIKNMPRKVHLPGCGKKSYLIDFPMANGEIITGGAVEKKLYQLIIGRLDGERISDPEYKEKIIRQVQNGIGGFILFGGSKDEAVHFIEMLQAAAHTPLFIAADIERGVGQQVNGATLFPCQMAMAAATDRLNPDDVRTLDTAIQSIAAEAAHIGINMPLIPVLDVNQDPDNPIICTRAFSDDPEVVSWFGMRYIEFLEKTGLVSCAKHFPGHGHTSVDSHIALPVIRKSYEEILGTDLVPFRNAVKQGVGSIMVGHLSVPAIDPAPASLSRVVHLMLRNTLGFEGLILTDALTMNALDDIPDAAVRCLNAGADILLHPADPGETVKTIASAVRSGLLPEDRIDAALTRIVKRKKTLRSIRKENVDYEAHAVLSAQLGEKSVSLVRGAPEIAPVAGGGSIHIFIAGENELSGSSPLRSLTPHVFMVGEHGKEMDIRNSISVIAIFTSIAAWKDRSGISRDERQLIHSVIRNSGKSIVVSFGNPYVLRHFPEADALVAAYEASDQAQRAVVGWITGSRRFQGRIPVSLS